MDRGGTRGSPRRCRCSGGARYCRSAALGIPVTLLGPGRRCRVHHGEVWICVARLRHGLGHERSARRGGCESSLMLRLSFGAGPRLELAVQHRLAPLRDLRIHHRGQAARAWRSRGAVPAAFDAPAGPGSKRGRRLPPPRSPLALDAARGQHVHHSHAASTLLVPRAGMLA